MTTNEEQEFLNSPEKKLWKAADKLRPTVDAAQSKVCWEFCRTTIKRCSSARA